MEQCSGPDCIENKCPINSSHIGRYNKQCKPCIWEPPYDVYYSEDGFKCNMCHPCANQGRELLIKCSRVIGAVCGPCTDPR